MAHDVFISYAREDSKVARAVVDHLQEEWGLNCWIDCDTIAHQGGVEWSEEIAAAIKQSRVMVVVFSDHVHASKWVKGEVHRAFDLEIPIIPLRIADVAPQGALTLQLQRAQWVDAFPLYENHLNQLASNVCDLLDRPATRTSPPHDAQARISWRRGMGAQLWYLQRRLSPPQGTKAPAAPENWKDAVPPKYGARKALHEAASKESPRSLAEAHRWWRIKQVIDSLESQGMPLGQFSQTRQPLEKRLAEFRQAYAAAEEAITKVGPSKARPLVDTVRSIVSDHPDIAALDARMNGITRDRAGLRQRIEGLARDNRWTAVENELRAFALEHRQTSSSLLHDAAKASAQAIRETRRFDLFVWTIVGGTATVGTCYCVERWLGMADGSFATQFSDSIRSLLVPVLAILVRFSTIGAIQGFLLASFGVRHQGTFAGAAIILMVLAAGAQAATSVAFLIPNGVPRLPHVIDFAITWAPCAVFGVALMSIVQFATCRLIGARPVFPGLTATLAASLASCGLMPDQGITGTAFEVRPWMQWLPSGCLCAGLLAASGLLVRRRDWWLPVAFSLGAGVLGSASRSAWDTGLLGRTAPMAVGLMVAGWVATRPTTVRGYLVLLTVACGSSLAVEPLRIMDTRDSMMIPSNRLSPVLALWAIACGTVAMRHKVLLSPTIFLRDIIAKQFLRIRCAGSNVADRQLAETRWFRDGRKWHTASEKPPATTNQSRRMGRLT